MVGHHPWSSILHSDHIGNVSGNAISGAVVLMWVDGIDAGTVVDNSLSNHQGTYTLFGCEYLVDSAKGHVWNATIQDGAEWITFDSGVCIPGEP